MERFSLHQFNNEKSLGFNPEDYSKFKFGSKRVARMFGESLADGFIKSKHFIDIMKLCSDGTRIVVLSSPYVFIPTATFAMKDYFIRKLNGILVEYGYAPVQEAKIYRANSYKEEYGEMTAEERDKVMSDDIFHADKEFLKDKVCLFLDDIIITGGHERRVKKMLDTYKIMPRAAYFLYFAELQCGDTHPKIENYLNYFFVDSLLDLDKIIKNDEFIMNTRAVKYILDYDHEGCKSFLNYQSETFLHNLYYQAIGNSYHLIPDYQKNLIYLKNLIK